MNMYNKCLANLNMERDSLLFVRVVYHFHRDGSGRFHRVFSLQR